MGATDGIKAQQSRPIDRRHWQHVYSQLALCFAGNLRYCSGLALPSGLILCVLTSVWSVIEGNVFLTNILKK